MSISKMVVDRQKSGSKVAAAARTHKGKARDGTAELLGEELGEAAEQLMEASADALEAATERMVAADEAHVAEIDDDAGVRAERDEASAEARRVLVDLREVTATMFGPAYVQQIGFEGQTPEDAVMVHRLGTRVLERMDKVNRPATRFEGMSFDPEPWKVKIATPVNALSTALEKNAAEERMAEQTLTDKHEAMAEYDRVFTQTAVLISALLRIAGEETLADRVRPNKSRPGRIPESDADVEPAEPAA